MNTPPPAVLHPQRRARLQRLASLSLICSLSGALLTACGGGGGGNSTTVTPAAAPGPVPGPVPSPSFPSAPTAVLASNANAASALLADALQRGRNMRLANGLTAGVTAPATGQGVSAIDLLTRNRILAVQDYSSVLCSSGQSSIEVPDAVLARFQADPNAKLAVGDTITLNSTRCVVKAAADLGSIALGDFGVGSQVDGRFKLAMVVRDDAKGSAVFTITYTAFSYTPYGGAAFAPLDAVLRFGSENGVSVYTLDLPDTRFLSVPQVVSGGNTVAVAAGSLRGLAPTAAGSGYVDYSFKGWTFDSTLARASAGEISVTGASGTAAVVTATGSGYTVRISTGARTDSYTLGF